MFRQLCYFILFPWLYYILFSVIIQLLVQFTRTCMLNTNHCHKTRIPWIPTAQTIDGDVMCQSSDSHLVFPTCSVDVTEGSLNFRFHIRFISVHDPVYTSVFLLPFARNFCLRILINLLVCIFSAFCFIMIICVIFTVSSLSVCTA